MDYLVNTHDLEAILLKNIDIENSPPSKNNTFVLFSNKPAEYDHRLGPFVHTIGLYKGLYRSNFEKWYIFNGGINYIKSSNYTHEIKIKF